MSKRFLSQKETAEALGVSEPTVAEMIRTGRLAATRATGSARSRLLIPASELDRFEREALASRVPDWSAQIDSNDLVEMVPGVNGGPVAQSKKHLFLAFKRVLDEGGSLEAALRAIEPKPLSAAERARIDAEWGED